MAFNVEAAKAAGYTDAEIQEFLSKEPVVEPEVDYSGEPPPPPGMNEVIVKEEIVKEEEDYSGEPPPPGAPIQPIEPSMGETAITYGVPAAGAGASAYGLYRIGKGLYKGGQNMMGPSSPKVTPTVTPSSPVKPSSILGADGRPMSKPVAPSLEVAKAEEAAAKARGTKISNIGRKFALLKSGASKVLGAVAPYASKASPLGTIAGMVIPSASESDYKYQFPITGPARGNEINQSTGKPWTKAELDVYYTQYPE